MMLVLDKYKIEKYDDMQFTLSVERMGKDKDGNDKLQDKLIGYYGYLDMALNKIINLEALEACEGSDVQIDAKNLLDGFKTLGDSLNNELLNKRPKDL